MTTIPPKYARRHKDGRILCANQHCGFRFGRIDPQGFAVGDGGFVPSEVALKQFEVSSISTYTQPGNRSTSGPFAMSKDARSQYVRAKRAGEVDRFIALPRPRDRHRVWFLQEGDQIVCPEHGISQISLAALGARVWHEHPAIKPDDTFVGGTAIPRRAQG